MSFTFNSPRKLSPEEANPMQALISRALETFGKTTKAANMQRQIDADIFAKEIGPLATLAGSQNFQGFNPEINKMIGERVGDYIGGHGASSGGEKSTEDNGKKKEYDADVPGYTAPDKIYKGLVDAANITEVPGGHGNVILSNLAGAATKLAGDNPISNALNAFNKNPNAGAEAAKGESMAADARRFLKLQNRSPQDIEDIVRKRDSETNIQYAERIRPYFIAGQKSSNAPITNIDQKIARDNTERPAGGVVIPRKLALMSSDDIKALHKSLLNKG
jgi:hypothetical protein